MVPVADYSRAHPTRAMLIIEVATTSHDKDRVVKAEIYARSGIPEYWIVDVVARTIEVRTQPGNSGYARTEVRRDGDVLAPAAFPDVPVAISKVLPAR